MEDTKELLRKLPPESRMKVIKAAHKILEYKKKHGRFPVTPSNTKSSSSVNLNIPDQVSKLSQ